MRRADFWADQTHYIDHMAPIYLALSPEVRGRFFAPVHLWDHAKLRGIDDPHPLVVPARALRGSIDTPVMVVGAFGGVKAWQSTRRPVVLLNHGAGQTFLGGHPSYSGGRGRERVALFLEPGPHAAEATRRSGVPGKVVEVGCAKLDPWHNGSRDLPSNAEPVIAFSTHWDCRVAPETRSAWWAYRDALLGLAGSYTVLAHAHPLIAAVVRPEAEAAGVEFVPHFEDVLARADLYIHDASSTGYEFASTGRPVVSINLPGYRRDAHHGLRFWDAAPGLQCDTPEALLDAVRNALTDPLEARAARAHGLARAYVACDGLASQRAADAITDLCRGAL